MRGETYALSLDRHPGKGERFVGLLAKASGAVPPVPAASRWRAPTWIRAARPWLRPARAASEEESWLEYPVTHGAEGRLEGDGGKNKLYDPPRGSVAIRASHRTAARSRSSRTRAGLGLGGRVMVLELASRRVEPLTEKALGEPAGIWPGRGTAKGGLGSRAASARTPAPCVAVTLKRQERLGLPGARLASRCGDIGPDGRVLFSQDEDRKVIVGVPAGETIPRDLSLHDLSGVADISSDGQWILFSDRGGLFVRRIVSPTRLVHLLASGYADALSPDGRSVLVTDRSRTRLQVLTRDVAAEPRGSCATPSR